jgi:pimeloyl-ACP methyl ester carboxylesterase
MDNHAYTWLPSGIKLHLVQKGDPKAPTILFLHGFPEFWYGWRHQLDFFVAQGFHVVAPDQRGYNKSDKPSAVKDYHIDLLAHDVIHLVQMLRKKKVYLVGHDWGAVVAWHLAIVYPQYFIKIGILNVPHPVVFLKNIKRNFNQLLKSWYMLFFQIPWLPEAGARLTKYYFFKQGMKNTANVGTFDEADIAQYQQAWAHENSLKYMIHWYRAAFRYPFNYKAYWDTPIKVPIQIIWGAKDAFLEYQLAEESLKHCENANLHPIPHATHWVALDAPDEVNKTLLTFFKNE